LIVQKLAILLPTYNEGPRLYSFLEALGSFLSSPASDRKILPLEKYLVIIDDGSTVPVDLSPWIQASGAFRSVHLLRHAINLGQGAALQTALQYARENLDCDFFCTIDADGQHDPGDMTAMIKTMTSTGADIVFGNRFNREVYGGIPYFRRLLLKSAIYFEWFLTGLRLSDSHNGYRIFGRKCANLIHLRQARMAHATEFKQIVSKNKLSYAESPVRISYSREVIEKGQTNLNAMTILKDLFMVYIFQNG
jgi:polyprenyl-phospho-N-acetylgalactosaminyl synthase